MALIETRCLQYTTRSPVRVETGSINRSISPDLQTQMIAGGIVEVLADSEVALRRQNRGMAERELNLFQGGPALVGQLGEGPPQVVRGNLPLQPAGVGRDGHE